MDYLLSRIIDDCQTYRVYRMPLCDYVQALYGLSMNYVLIK